MKKLITLGILSFVFAISGVASAETSTNNTPQIGGQTTNYVQTVRLGDTIKVSTSLSSDLIYTSTNFTVNRKTTVSVSGEYTPTVPGVVAYDYNYQYANPDISHIVPGVQYYVLVLPENVTKLTNMYRLYNPYSGEHFYTHSSFEKNNLIAAGWNYEGSAWQAPHLDKSIPVYRIYNPNSGLHHYTKSKTERDYLISLGWQNEGIAWYSNSDAQHGLPIYRVYNPNSGQHFFTSDKNEKNKLVSLGWCDEGIAWYGLI